jgi:hypothetical protein
MATDPYIPRADEAFRTFAANFAGNILAAPSTYGLTPAEAAHIMDKFVRFDEAYKVAANPDTRTRPSIAVKDDARHILQNTISNYSAHIRANLGVTDGDKENIGVRPRNIARNTRRAPTVPPLLQFIGSLPGIDQLLYHHTGTPESKAKPYGVQCLELYRAYSLPGEPRPKKAQAEYFGPFKKNKMLVPRDPIEEDRGAQATYWGAWRGFDGTLSPWSLPCSMSLARVKPGAQTKSQQDEGDMDVRPRLAA